MPTRERRAQMLGVDVASLVDGRGRHGQHVRGSEHYRWNDSRILSEHGYVKLRVGESHPLADPNGYAYEHLIVWCSAGNARPTDDQVLHHRNEDKQDNRYDNLELTSRADHNSHHIADRARDDLGRLLPHTLDGREHSEFPA